MPRSVARHTSTLRSFVYVDSSGERRRIHAACALLGISSRSGPSRRPNQWSRAGTNAGVLSTRAVSTASRIGRSRTPFSSSLRATGSATPVTSVSSSFRSPRSARRSSLNPAETASVARPSASRRP